MTRRIFTCEKCGDSETKVLFKFDLDFFECECRRCEFHWNEDQGKVDLSTPQGGRVKYIWSPELDNKEDCPAWNETWEMGEAKSGKHWVKFQEVLE